MQLQHPRCLHGLLQIGDDALGVLQSNAEAEEALLIDGGVVGELVAVPIIVDDQALNVAQRHGVGHQMQGIEEGFVLLLVALQVEGDHAGILTVHELFRQRVLRMALQTRIPHEAGGRAQFQKFRHRHGDAAVLLHPQRRGGKPAGDQPRIEGAEDAAVVVPYRTGNHSDLAACFSFYTTKDNKQLFVAINGPGPVEKGYPIIGVGTPGVTPGLPKGIPGFPLNTPMGQKADQALTDFCAQHTCAELEEIFNKAGIPNQRAYEPGDIENDPQYAERENLVEWEDQIFGEMKGIGITNRFKNNPSKIVASAPCFGEHNREVLKDFGYTDEEIDALYKKGELVTWTPADTARIRHLPDWGFFWDTERQCERIGMEWPLKDE